MFLLVLVYFFNCSHILLFFSRKNVVKSSARSSAVLPDDIRFSTFFPVSLMMIWKSPLVYFLFLFIWFDMTCFLWQISRQLICCSLLCKHDIDVVVCTFSKHDLCFWQISFGPNVLVKPRFHRFVGKLDSFLEQSCQAFFVVHCWIDGLPDWGLCLQQGLVL